MSIIGNAISPLVRRRGDVFDPLTDLQGTLAQWLQRDYVITSTPDIDQINDEAGNFDATQVTVVRKPHEITDIAVLNGFKTCLFDGSNDFLDAGSAFQAPGRDQLGYGWVGRINDGQPASSELAFGTRTNPVTDRHIYPEIQSTGNLKVRFRANNNEGVFRSLFQLANGNNRVGIIVWVDKDGDNRIKVGLAKAGTFIELADDGADDGDLTGVTPANLTIADNLYWGCLNNGGAPVLFSNCNMGEGFVQSGMTQQDFDNWGQRFLEVYGL